MARHRRIFIILAGIALLAFAGHWICSWLYSHSTLAEAAPLRTLEEHLDPEIASIGSDLVDGYWSLTFHGPDATDQAVRDALPYLAALPTHRPIDDPLGDDRSFRVTLVDTDITDAGVQMLNELPLAQFIAIDTALSDASLDTLESQQELHWIYLSGTDVSTERRQQYSEMHPRCAVIDAKEDVAKIRLDGETESIPQE